MWYYHADGVSVELVSAEDLDKVPFSKIFANAKPVKLPMPAPFRQTTRSADHT
jgi:hypothetical protein